MSFVILHTSRTKSLFHHPCIDDAGVAITFTILIYKPDLSNKRMNNNFYVYNYVFLYLTSNGCDNEVKEYMFK